ncbi:MAG: hypothetical protein HYT87_10205 [Nitrospirae bacterium]|nr:hypothetical protein [Nitrospirota bacterium]
MWRRALAVGLILAGCESAQTGPLPDGTELEISGQLVAGSAVEGVRTGVRGLTETEPIPGITRPDEGAGTSPRRTGREKRQSSFEAGQPLPDYGLFCVTFEENPRSGKGAANKQGRFELKIQAAGIPFGCFVVDPSGKRIADLFFVGDRQLSSGDHELTGAMVFDRHQNLGRVWVDFSTAVALAGTPLETGPSPPAEEDAWDPTGTWAFAECLDIAADKPCSGADLLLHAALSATYPALYYHRIEGRDDLTGKRRYLFDIWHDKESYVACGQTEGMSRQQARDLHGLELDPEVNTTPFGFLGEPPGPNSWDANDSCVGPTDLKGTIGRCVSVTDPGLQALCYKSCWQNYDSQGLATCHRARTWNDAYIQRHLESLERGESPVYDRAAYLTLLPFPQRSLISSLGSNALHPEMRYQNGHTWSIATLSINPSYFKDTSGRYRQCDIVFSFQMNASRLSPEDALATAVVGANVSNTSPDFQWCLQYARQSLPQIGLNLSDPTGTGIRFRTRLRRVKE